MKMEMEIEVGMKAEIDMEFDIVMKMEIETAGNSSMQRNIRKKTCVSALQPK